MARVTHDRVEPVTEATYDEAMESIAKNAESMYREFAGVTSFPVTCEIGRITISEAGTGEHPIMAAFRMVYEHDTPGTFRFPDGFGEYIQVIVPKRSSVGEA